MKLLWCLLSEVAAPSAHEQVMNASDLQLKRQVAKLQVGCFKLFKADRIGKWHLGQSTIVGIYWDNCSWDMLNYMNMGYEETWLWNQQDWNVGASFFEKEPISKPSIGMLCEARMALKSSTSPSSRRKRRGQTKKTWVIQLRRTKIIAYTCSQHQSKECLRILGQLKHQIQKQLTGSHTCLHFPSWSFGSWGCWRVGVAA